jgi:hypothetical protein
MLSGEDKARADAAVEKRFGQGSELDDFRTRTGN